MLKIFRTSTPDGYRVEVECDRPGCVWIGEVDPQQPMWAVFVKMEEHYARYHQPFDRTALKAQVRSGKNQVRTVELPDED